MYDANTAVDREGLCDVLIKAGEAGTVDLVTQLGHTDHLARLVLDREA